VFLDAQYGGFMFQNVRHVGRIGFQIFNVQGANFYALSGGNFEAAIAKKDCSVEVELASSIGFTMADTGGRAVEKLGAVSAMGFTLGAAGEPGAVSALGIPVVVIMFETIVAENPGK
jgi:hypothetical protein